MKHKRLTELPVISTAMVIINVIVFLICTFTGNLLYNKGVLAVSPVLVRKEYGRIIWAMFLHADFMHLFNNMILVFFLGAMLEKEIGHIRLCIVYLLSGEGGNVLSLAVKALSADEFGTVGASGAIFGLDGMLLALVLLSSKKTVSITPGRVFLMILISLYGGYSGTNIDHAAHVGGLLTGFVTGIIMCAADRIKESARQTNELM